MTDQIEGVFIPFVKAALWILSQIYWFLLALRRLFYRIGILKRHGLSLPVISVGNLTLGGVGKTPLIEYLVRILKENGFRPVVLTRGYMAKKAGHQAQGSDEAAMVEAKWHVPVLAGADRFKNAKKFMEKIPVDVFLLDDGFQHWRLGRDLDIVAIDATNPWGNGHLLPRGILREPKKALSRADIFVLTKIDLGNERLEDIRKDLAAINPKAPIVEAIHKPVLFSDLRSNDELDLASIQGERICTVCGVGSPNSFIKTLVELEADIDEHFAFLDHHVYSAADIQTMIHQCQKKGIAVLVTTEKDAVKLGAFLNLFPDSIRVLSLKIEIVIVSGEGEFLERINHLL